MAVSYPIPEGIVGSDNRLVTVVDGSPTILYTTVVVPATQVYRVSIEIVAHAYTSGTATYTVTWTENGVSQTAVVTGTALNTVTGIVRLAMPDANTTRLTIADCNIINPSASGLNIRSNAGVCFIYGNRIQSFFSPVNKVSTGSGISLNGNADGHVFQNDVGGFITAGQAGILLNNISDFAITGNQIYVNSRGIDAYLPSVLRITGNNISTNRSMGLLLHADLAGTWKEVTVTGNTVRNNGTISANTQDGIQLATDGVHPISGIVIDSNTCADVQGSATQRYGINVLDTGVQNCRISNNICFGNVSAQINLGAVGTGLSVYGNIGFNPQGVAVISVTASPFTYTNNDGVPEAVYITPGSGGTISQIAKNAVNLLNANLAGQATVWLEPGEAVTITYATATAVMNKDRK
jgi:copper-binding protein NosD